MEIIVRYEFVVIPNNGDQSMLWGYRKHKKAARKRFKELKAHFEERDCTVEVQKIVSHETRHITDIMEE